MSNVTIAACANSTPPAGTVVATCALSDSSNAQLMMLADQSRNIYGVTGSPMVVSGSAVVTNQVSASISNLAGSAAGSPLFVLQTNNTGSAAGSPTFVSVTNAASVVVSSGSVVVTNPVSASISNTVNAVILNLAGSAAGSPLFVTQTNMVGSAAGSPIFASVTNVASVVVSSGSVVVTNGLSASISNTTLTVIPGASGASPWGVKILDSSGNAYGVAAGSPLYITGGAAGGTSATDQSSYAAGTTNFTPAGGFYSTNPVTLTACQSGAFRMTAQRAQHVRLSDESGNVLGVSGSPIYVTGGAGGTSATDQGAFGEAAGTYTPAGFWFFETAASLTACQAGIGRMTAYRAQHINLRDASGNQLGVTGSPLVTSITAASVTVTNQVSASISNTLTVGNALSASISGGSVALLAGTNAIGVASVVQASPNTLANAWPVRLSDTTDSVAVTAASELLVSVNNSPSVVVSAGSAVITNQVSASISNFPALADKATFAEGTTVATPIQGLMLNTTACLTASQVGAVRINEWRAQHVTLRTASGNELGAAAGSPLFATITNMVGSAAGSPQFVSVTNAASVIVSSGSVVVTNGLSASISNTASVIVSSGSVVVTNALSASISNVASVIVSSGSVVVTNALSASVSGGSVALLAGANTIGVASAIQGAPNGIANAWPAYLATNTGSFLGYSGSPLAVTGDVERLYFAGSLVTASTINLSASTSGCIRIVASTSGQAIMILAATFTTSSCQNIGWVASGAGGASALVQSPMPFGTNGGMDSNRMPHAALWKFPSGSNAVMTTTSACIIAGTLTYISVAS